MTSTKVRGYGASLFLIDEAQELNYKKWRTAWLTRMQHHNAHYRRFVPEPTKRAYSLETRYTLPLRLLNESAHRST